MQWYQIQNDNLVQTPNRMAEQAVCICTPDELESGAFSVAQRTVSECRRGGFSKMEAYDGYDFILLNIGGAETQYNLSPCGLYLFPQMLVFASYDISMMQGFLNGFIEKKTVPLSLLRIIYAFFDNLTLNDSEELTQLEDEIESLEERIMEDAEGNYIQEIHAVRKQLMFYKKFYEQLLDVGESIEENQNELFSSAALRRFRMFTARVERLMNHTENLRDYIAQVREAYQSQTDLRLNKTMKFYTVITTIFLPLSLIAGWYGMNFADMPELSWQHGYLYAGCLSITSILVSVWYIRKKNL